jgi:diguanylate cyclase (GGDEF)-like protein
MPAQAQAIPSPVPITISPGMFVAYGALVAAAVLMILYLYRGRAFVVYWIGSWLLVAASMMLLARGYDDVRLGSVVLGLAQLLSVWAAGLMLLAAEAFPDDPLRWTIPLKVAAGTAVWFLAGPFVLPLHVMLSTGPGLAAILFGWGSLRYYRVGRRTRHIGAYVLCAGMVLTCATSVAAAGAAFDVQWGASAINRLLAFTIGVSMFVALGMQLLVFEDMTDELRRTNRELAFANREVKNLAITDPLTGCHNRRFFEEIERREIQRHRRYGAPLSIVFTDVNHFKRFNDTMGHETGDRILTTIGAFLRRQVRESDYVIRWGGDEFLLLLTCGYSEARRKAAELKVAFEHDRVAGSLPDGLGLSIGVASASVDADSLAETIREADSRMYEDKMADRPAARSVQ